MSTDLMWRGTIYFICIYAGKYGVMRYFKTWLLRSIYFMVLFVLALMFVYIYLEDWDAPDLESAAHWIGAPLLYLTIPTSTFIFDAVRRKTPSLRFYMGRTIIEICVFPLWMYVVAFIHDQMGWIYF